jgi:hypothetical protein
MEHWTVVLFGGVIIGVMFSMVAGVLLMIWEDKSPYARNPTPDQKAIFAHFLHRMALCTWAVSGIMYIALTYWWKD